MDDLIVYATSDALREPQATDGPLSVTPEGPRKRSH